MQTFPTHVLCGAVVAQVALNFNLTPVPDLVPWYLWWGAVWVVCIGGAILPDVPYALYMVYHTIKKTPVAEYASDQGPIITHSKEASHSLFVWGLLWCVAWYLVPVVSALYPVPPDILEACRHLFLAFTSAGILGGVLPDIPSHVSKGQRSRDGTIYFDYTKTDCTYLWGIGWLFKILFGISTFRPEKEVKEGDSRMVRWMKDHLLREYRIAPSVLFPLKTWEADFNLFLLGMLCALWLLSLINFPSGHK